VLRQAWRLFPGWLARLPCNDQEHWHRALGNHGESSNFLDGPGLVANSIGKIASKPGQYQDDLDPCKIADLGKTRGPAHIGISLRVMWCTAGVQCDQSPVKIRQVGPKRLLSNTWTAATRK